MTGRIARIKMQPMSLYESHESSGDVSLKQLFDDKEYLLGGEVSSMTVNDIIYSACRGGLPASLRSDD